MSMSGIDRFTVGVVQWEGVVVVGVAALLAVTVITLVSVALDMRRWRPGRAAKSRHRRDAVSGRQSAPGLAQDSEPSDIFSEDWAAWLATMDEMLPSRDTAAAARAWLEAYRAVRNEPTWEGYLAVGAGRLRVAALTGARKEGEAKARQLYLTALFRARQQRSVDGILRSVEALAALGDRQVVDHALRLAASVLAEARDTDTETRLRAILQALNPNTPGNPALESA